VVQEWARKASQLPGFEFSLKMPKQVTHDSLLEDVATAQAFETKVLAPLKAATALGAVLVQASPGLRGPEHLDRLDAFLGALDTRAYDYAVELRHRSWLAGDALEPAAAAVLRRHDVACCAVDGPSMPPVFEQTGRHAYLRLHGRNRDLWFSQKRDPDGRMNRYDYVYSREELEPWRVKLAPVPGTARVYFNNHPRANAVRNAKLFEFMLGLAPEPALPPVQRQAGLSRFFE
jgi:uncharacterized protein YecE (DUF72 family)